MVTLQTGTIIDGRFTIGDLLGEGGMGAVFSARQAGLNRTVAIKILHSLGGSTDVPRFEREADILSKLNHPGIPRFYHYGLWNTIPYFVMELLEGTTLRQILLGQTQPPPSTTGRSQQRAAELHEGSERATRQPGPATAIQFTLQVCSAVGYAHNHGVVHRDLTPNNILIAPDGTVRVMDFGLSYFVEEEKQRLTQTGSMIGSVYYMSPEQCAGLKADYRSDIYSLGCVLYELIAGEPPFQACNPIGLLHKHRYEDLPDLQQRYNVMLPAGLQVALENATRKDPSLRYQSMSEFEEDLRCIIAGEGAALRSSLNHSAPATSPAKRIIQAACLAGILLITAGLASALVRRNTELGHNVLPVSKVSAPAVHRVTDRIGLKAVLSQMRKLYVDQKYNEVIRSAESWKQLASHDEAPRDLFEFNVLCFNTFLALGKRTEAIAASESALKSSYSWNEKSSRHDLCAMEAHCILSMPALVQDKKMLSRADQLLTEAGELNFGLFFVDKSLVTALKHDEAEFRSYAKQALDAALKSQTDDARSESRLQLIRTAQCLLGCGELAYARLLLDYAEECALDSRVLVNREKQLPPHVYQSLIKPFYEQGLANYQHAALTNGNAEEAFQRWRRFDDNAKSARENVDLDSDACFETLAALQASKQFHLAERLAHDSLLRIQSAGASKGKLQVLFESQIFQELKLGDLKSAEQSIDSYEATIPHPQEADRIPLIRVQLAIHWRNKGNLQACWKQLQLARAEARSATRRVDQEYLVTYHAVVTDLTKQGRLAAAKQQKLQGHAYAESHGLKFD